ncbi:MAG: DUF3047 domain-containing protein [Pseudomonadota bacterium]
MSSRRRFLAFCLGCFLWRRAEAQAAVQAMPFSSLKPGAPLPEWLEPYAFPSQPRHTEYAPVEDEGRTVLRARANASTSGMVRALRVDPRAHPLLAWRWKVMRLVAKSDMASKAGDDFPARLYVTFDLDPATLDLGTRMKLAFARAVWGGRVPLAALCYVWDARLPVDTMAPNAYTDRVRMVVAESGAARLGRWVTLERDVAADYRRAFGAEPPIVNGVIVAADTDNTGETAESYFGDIEFRPRRTS